MDVFIALTAWSPDTVSERTTACSRRWSSAAAIAYAPSAPCS